MEDHILIWEGHAEKYLIRLQFDFVRIIRGLYNTDVCAGEILKNRHHMLFI